MIIVSLLTFDLYQARPTFNFGILQICIISVAICATSSGQNILLDLALRSVSVLLCVSVLLETFLGDLLSSWPLEQVSFKLVSALSLESEAVLLGVANILRSFLGDLLSPWPSVQMSFKLVSALALES